MRSERKRMRCPTLSRSLLPDWLWSGPWSPGCWWGGIKESGSDLVPDHLDPGEADQGIYYTWLALIWSLITWMLVRGIKESLTWLALIWSPTTWTLLRRISESLLPDWLWSGPRPLGRWRGGSRNLLYLTGSDLVPDHLDAGEADQGIS